MGACVTVTDALVDISKRKSRWRWQSVKARRLRRPRGGTGLRIELSISNVRGGQATIREALRRLTESRAITTSMIGMQTADIVSVRVLCIPGHDVIQALLRTRKVGHPFVLALRTKLIKQLDEVGDEKA